MTDLDRIARPSGGFAMVAMDQRDSLRTMFLNVGVSDVSDELLVAFKYQVAEVLGPLASGLLIDRDYGFEQIRDAHVLPATTGLILAADLLDQEQTKPVEDTSLDSVVTADDYDLQGIAALKLLVIWRRDARRADRVRMAREFSATCARRGVLSVLEPVVRATQAELDADTWNTEDAIVEAASELSATGQSLYKVQVPLGGRPVGAALERELARVNEAITGPWVVLSQGVTVDDFLGAVMAACQAGASGFLAGRGLWSDVVGTPRDRLTERLIEVSAPRLRRLAEVVDAEATPWREK